MPRKNTYTTTSSLVCCLSEGPPTCTAVPLCESGVARIELNSLGNKATLDLVCVWPAFARHWPKCCAQTKSRVVGPPHWEIGTSCGVDLCADRFLPWRSNLVPPPPVSEARTRTSQSFFSLAHMVRRTHQLSWDKSAQSQSLFSGSSLGERKKEGPKLGMYVEGR